jgi:LacI family transcriptional regulator
MTKKPTIKDIAKIAKVSNTAVSMALRGHTRIGQETRQKILRIAKRLDYQPNFIARSLVIKKTNTIGLIITSILNPFYPELAKGIEDKAMELGYNIILCSTNYDLKLEKYFIDILKSKGVDGIIFASVEVNDPNIKPLIEENFPFILVNRRIHNRFLNKRIDYIVLDNFSGGYMAMEHLYQLGHRRVGIIAGDLNTSTAIERIEGAKKLLKEYGLKLDQNLLMECNFSKELAYHATKKFLSMKLPPSAIFAENDYMALGVREAILESGLKIPENMALIGFDDIAFSATKGVELTTIRQKKYDMGTLAVEVLVEKIEKRSPRAVTQITLEPEIIIRNSCGHRLYGYQNEKSLNINVSQKNPNVQIGHFN